MNKIALFALCIFVAFMPFEMMAAFEELPSGAKMSGAFCVFAAILSLLAGHRLRRLSWPMVVRMVIVLFSVFSVLWSVDRDATLVYLPRMGLLAIFVLILWEFAPKLSDHVWLLRSMLAGMLVPLAMGIVQARGASRFVAEEGLRYGGGGQDLNYLAFMYSVSIVVAVYLATGSASLDRYLRWCYWGMAALCALGILLTGSRGGFISLVAAGLFAMVLGGASRHRIITILQLLAVAACAFVLIRYVVPEVLISRVTLEGGGASVEEDPRVHIWKVGLAALWQNPLLGVGAGAFAPATTPTGQKMYVAHNAYLSAVVELGFIGLALYVAYTVMLFRAAWRLPRREKLLWTGVMVVWFLSANTAGSHIDKFSWFLHVMVLVQAAAFAKSHLARKPFPSARSAMPLVRRPMPPPLGRP